MRFTSLAFIAAATQAQAAPTVVTDIGPVQGIVAAVMGEVGTPDVLIPAGVDAHDYTMRPSDAARLNDADVVIWVGEGMTPWLEKSVTTLGSSALVLELLDTSGWVKRATSEAGHEDHDDDHDEHKDHDDDHEDHGEDHDDHEDHDGHDDHDEHKDHDDDHDDHEDHDDHAGHDHGDVDPHAWLDPTVAAVWAGHVADTLAQADPANAQTYADNAAKFGAELDDTSKQIKSALASYDGAALIWPHDAYGYFAQAFDINSAGSIADASARDPGPAHIAELRDIVRDQDVSCVLTDHEIGEKWATLVRDGSSAGTGYLDPLGAAAPAGAGHYTALITDLAAAITGCQGHSDTN